MASPHGSRGRYKSGCRCAGCRAAQATYQARYRDRVLAGETRPAPVAKHPDLSNRHHGADLPVAPRAARSCSDQGKTSVRTEVSPVGAGPGPVEAAVQLELAELSAAQSQPGIAAACVALGRVLDGKIPSPKPSAAGKLAALLAGLRKDSGRAAGGGLRMVRSMTQKGPH
jgi:hypothetical protein